MKVATLFDPAKNSLLEGTPGRSERLLARRDKDLCTRYFFFMRHKRFSYLKACEELSQEFYISVIQVQKVLKSNADNLDELRKQQPTIKQLEKEYTRFTWV